MLTSSEEEEEKGAKFTTFSTLKFKVIFCEIVIFGVFVFVFVIVFIIVFVILFLIIFVAVLKIVFVIVLELLSSTLRWTGSTQAQL